MGDKLRGGFFSLAGVKDELKKLRPSELAVLLAGNDYISGELVMKSAHIEPAGADISAFGDIVRSLPADDVRRLLYAATGVATLNTELTIVVSPASSPDVAKISFRPLFARVELELGAEADVATALGIALVKLDQP